MSDDTIRVRVWHGYPDRGDYLEPEAWGEPDEVVEVPVEEVYVWQNEPRWRRKIGVDIHPDDGPAKLDVFVSDSVHGPPDEGSSRVERGYWDGPIEGGFGYPPEHEYPPFATELGGRVAFRAEPTVAEMEVEQ